MSKFIASRFASLDAYVPGEQPSDMQYIKLNTNESPFKLPDVIKKAAESEVEKLNLYPNPDGLGLINKIAELYEVMPENVIIGNGSDELLAFAFLAFFEEGVVFPDITYGFYPVYAELYNVPFRRIPLREDFTIDVGEYISAGANIVIANPNAPTGIALEPCDIEAITQSNTGKIVMIDEAYIDFGGKTVIPLTHKYENLLVVHTFSKSRSMAGSRLAFAIGQAQIIEDLRKMKYSFNPYNVNRLTQCMGQAALNAEDHFIKKRQEIIKTREYTKRRLGELGFIMTDSSANFLFGTHPDIKGLDLYLKLKDMGILVRHWEKSRISNHVRITIGTKEQMEALLTAVESILEEKKYDHLPCY